MRPAPLASLAFAVAALAACGDGRVVLELQGDLPGTHVEVLLLEPEVHAKLQLHHGGAAGAEGSLEMVFYMAERSRTSISIGAAETDGFQLEIAGAGGPYVPLVALRAGEELVALGLHDPDSVFAARIGGVHTPAAVSPVSDVTIYPIALERVAKVLPAGAAPQPVRPGEVLTVPCKPNGAANGLAWRRGDGRQLRVLVARDGSDRLEPPDLDCDAHSPGKAGVRTDLGDQGDCDDTAFLIHAKAREQCSRIDEDCNAETALAEPRACASTCLSPVCLCGDEGPTQEVCPMPVSDPCKVRAMSTSTGLQVCDSAGPIRLAPCQGGCEVLIESVPAGLEAALADAPGRPGAGPGEWVEIPDGVAWLTVGAARPLAGPDHVIALRIKTAAGTSPPAAIVLQLLSLQCEVSPSVLDCPP